MGIPKYKLTIDPKHAEEGEELGVFEIANTATPAIRIKGVAFKSHEVKPVHFADDLKYRIAAPILTPGDVYRKDEETGAEEYWTVTEEFIDDVMMQTASMKDKLIFNVDHIEGSVVPAYLLESWKVEDPKTDKAFTQFGIEVPKGTWFGIEQYTDKDVYFQHVKEGKTGFSIDGKTALKFAAQDTGKYADMILSNGNGEYLMLKRTSDDKVEGGKFGFPGGKVEPGESPMEAAKRELSEEAGITIENCDAVRSIKNDDGTESHYFSAVVQDTNVQLSDEHVSAEWMTPEQIAKADVIFDGSERYVELIEKSNNTDMSKTTFKLDGVEYTADEQGNLTPVATDAKMEDDAAVETPTDEKKEGEEEDGKEGTQFEEKKEESKDVEAKEEEKKEEEKAEMEDEKKEEEEEEKKEDAKMEDEKAELQEEEEETPAEMYTRAEIDQKFSEVFDAIAKLKGEAEEEEEGTEMSDQKDTQFSDQKGDNWVVTKMGKLDAIKTAGVRFTEHSKNQ